MPAEDTARGGLRRTTGAHADRCVEDLRARLQVGAPPGSLRDLPARVRRAVEVSRVVGGSALAALDAATAAVDDERQLQRAVRVASSEARAVILGLALLPVAALTGLGALLDLPLWRFYLTGVGPVVGVLGVGLAGIGVLVARGFVRRVSRPRRRSTAGSAVVVVLAAVIGALLAGMAGALPAAAVAASWQRRRATRPDRPDSDTDEVADLLALATSAGLTGAAGLRVVADVLPSRARDLRRAALALELAPREAAATTAGLDRVVATVAAAQRHGAPVSDALTRLARDLRAAELARALAAAERLPALLTFPTALCLLPASILLVGAPLVAFGLSAAGGVSGP